MGLVSTARRRPTRRRGTMMGGSKVVRKTSSPSRGNQIGNSTSKRVPVTTPIVSGLQLQKNYEDMMDGRLYMSMVLLL